LRGIGRGFRRRTKNGGVPAAVFLAVWMIGEAGAGAHELGSIRTTVTFERKGTFHADVVIDREHLPPGFGSASTTRTIDVTGVPPGSETRAARIVAEVAAASEAIFDGRATDTKAEWMEADPAAPEFHLRLSGAIPGGARTFAWRSRARVGTYLLTIRTEGEAAPVRLWLEGGETSAPVPLRASVVPPTRSSVIRQYLGLGYTHILPKGTDHILFVLGIFLLSRRLKPILLQVTAFTIAHTITLALTIYGVVSLRPAIVEPLIALSIVYVAVENVFTSELNPWRVALVFGFGLIHGMGFAGVLSELGLPRSEFLPALVSFNVGVELGQLTVILAAFLLVGLPFRDKPWYRRRVVVPASLVIAAIGLFWAVQRIVGKP
jgi:hydrogenase/urease accessory protein HupE